MFCFHFFLFQWIHQNAQSSCKMTVYCQKIKNKFNHRQDTGVQLRPEPQKLHGVQDTEAGHRGKGTEDAAYRRRLWVSHRYAAHGQHPCAVQARPAAPGTAAVKASHQHSQEAPHCRMEPLRWNRQTQGRMSGVLRRNCNRKLSLRPRCSRRKGR